MAFMDFWKINFQMPDRTASYWTEIEKYEIKRPSMVLTGIDLSSSLPDQWHPQ